MNCCGDRYTRRSLSSRRKPSGRRRYCRHLPAEPERMISGRTFAREMIALRQRETKRAGRILALQGQNPGQVELRTHSEFGANLSVAPGALPSSVLELALEEAVQPDIILSGSALRKQNHSISFSSQRCHPPGRKTHIHPPPPRPLVLTCLTKSLFKVRDNQRPERTISGVAKTSA